MLLLVLSVGAVGSASSQIIIIACRPCIALYQACIASGQPQSTCQAQQLQCCLAQSGKGAKQAIADRRRTTKSG
jgi:hypothetical protein